MQGHLMADDLLPFLLDPVFTSNLLGLKDSVLRGGVWTCCLTFSPGLSFPTHNIGVACGCGGQADLGIAIIVTKPSWPVGQEAQQLWQHPSPHLATPIA